MPYITCLGNLLIWNWKLVERHSGKMWENYLLCPHMSTTKLGSFIFCSLHIAPRGRLGQTWPAWPDVRLTPVFMIVHFLRWNIREKFKLLSDLKDFESWHHLGSSWIILASVRQHGCTTASRSSPGPPPVLRCPQDLEKAFCRTAFDRSFVHSAIVKWYGSSLDGTAPRGDQP